MRVNSVLIASRWLLAIDYLVLRLKVVMRGLDPRIHVFLLRVEAKDVDGRAI
jgi:hypothetical protein